MESNMSFYYQTWFVIITLILFFPVGLFLMWKTEKFPKDVRIVISIFFGLMIIISSFTLGQMERKADSPPKEKTRDEIVKEKAKEIKVKRKKEGLEVKKKDHIQDKDSPMTREEELHARDRAVKKQAEQIRERRKTESPKLKSKKIKKTTPEQEYRNMATELADSIETKLGHFSNLIYDLSIDSNVINNQNWILDLADAIKSIDSDLDKMLALDAPDKFKEVDELYKEAADHYKSIPKNMPSAIDNRSTSMMSKTTKDIDSGNSKLHEATKEIKGMSYRD